MKKIIVLSFAITVICHFVGKYFDLYNQIFEYDSLMHFLGGIFAGSLGLHFTGKQKRDYYLFAFCSAFIIGALWELMQRYIQKDIYPISDITLDMIMDVLGAVALVFFLLAKRNTKKARWILFRKSILIEK